MDINSGKTLGNGCVVGPDPSGDRPVLPLDQDWTDLDASVRATLQDQDRAVAPILPVQLDRFLQRLDDMGWNTAGLVGPTATPAPVRAENLGQPATDRIPRPGSRTWRPRKWAWAAILVLMLVPAIEATMVLLARQAAAHPSGRDYQRSATVWLMRWAASSLTDALLRPQHIWSVDFLAAKNAFQVCMENRFQSEPAARRFWERIALLRQRYPHHPLTEYLSAQYFQVRASQDIVAALAPSGASSEFLALVPWAVDPQLDSRIDEAIRQRVVDNAHRAAVAYEKAKSLKPDHPLPYNNQAVAYHRMARCAIDPVAKRDQARSSFLLAIEGWNRAVANQEVARSARDLSNYFDTLLLTAHYYLNDLALTPDESQETAAQRRWVRDTLNEARLTAARLNVERSLSDQARLIVSR